MDMLRVDLSFEEMPSQWYNILPDLPEPVPPPLDPRSKRPLRPEELASLFAETLVRQETCSQRFVDIPKEVLDAYVFVGRPTPLIRAKRLERALGTPAKIYYKYEGATLTGSHKINTAIPQVYYNSLEGVSRVVTETGAGQWGSALALAGAIYGVKVRVYMTRSSYLQKPYRRVLMELYGAEVYPSPSRYTETGRRYLAEDPDHPGSLGIAISEAIEDVVRSGDAKYCLGSVLNHVLMHQTVIGLEAKRQMEILGEYPDYVVGCVGGGSNFAGLAYPFLMDRLRGKSETVFVAAEPRASPSMTRGVYEYDYGDSVGLTPLIKMYTVGHSYKVPPIHAGGLRYHGVAPTLSILVKHGYVTPIAYHQTEVFRAAKIFAENEGIVVAPETAHAVKAVIDIALEAKRRGQRRTILFNLSGHGLLDLKSYEAFLAGRLRDYEPGNLPRER